MIPRKNIIRISERWRQEIKYDDVYDQKDFNEIQYALYGLAKFKKKEDVKLIKDLLLSDIRQMGQLSFNLMKDFPDTAYMEVYEHFYPRSYYRRMCTDQTSENAVYFIHSIAEYKNAGSAKILDSILNRKPFVNCVADTGYLREELIYAIWNNKCDAYSKLRKQIEKRVQEYEKGSMKVQPVTSMDFPEDSASENIRWAQ